MNTKLNKPSKKTEWETLLNDICDSYSIGSIGQRAIEELCKICLHQRDNEIREKIQGMKKHRLDSPRSFGDGDVVNVASGYNQAIDDLLTYLSNREV